jgi:hypothetical protein
MSSDTIASKCVTSLYKNEDEPPTVMIGIPADVYARMKDGKAFIFDFSTGGVPVRVTLYGGETKEDCEKTLQRNATERGVFMVDDRNRKPGVKPS